MDTNRPTRRCSEREPADSLGDKFNARGGWLPSLTYALGIITNTTKIMRITRYSLGCFFTAIPVAAVAADGASGTGLHLSAPDTGVSAIWILANTSYAGMRAQNSSSKGWRVASFIFGFPGTLLTYFVVPEGGERAYGIEIPKKR